MTLFDSLTYWWSYRRAKTISADEAYKISTSPEAWRKLMRDIAHYASFGMTMNSTGELSEEFQDRLLSLGYSINQTSLIDWKQKPSLESIERRIESLIKIRDEMKKEQLIKELADIEEDNE